MGFVSANNMGGIIKHGDTYWIFWGYIDGVDGMRVCRVCSLNIEYLPCLKMGENMKKHWNMGAKNNSKKI